MSLSKLWVLKASYQLLRQAIISDSGHIINLCTEIIFQTTQFQRRNNKDYMAPVIIETIVKSWNDKFLECLR